ncbi:hypothetical protein [Deinococcus pimensis]|uniref:hypothetical protein n=1 Tax=Deinococcus pimensis TaxID=309888 RepID=UPI0012F8E0E6|nr:hypothetical protein [Deinococcus pimensis]
MKKMILVAILAASSAAGAQAIQLSGGASLTNLNFGGNFGITAQSLANFNGVDLDGRLSVDLSGGDVGTFVNADLLFNFPQDAYNLYAGLGLSAALGGVNSSLLFGTATIGAAFPVADQIGVFAEAALRFNGQQSLVSRSVVRAGLTYVF